MLVSNMPGGLVRLSLIIRDRFGNQVGQPITLDVNANSLAYLQINGLAGQSKYTYTLSATQFLSGETAPILMNPNSGDIFTK